MLGILLVIDLMALACVVYSVRGQREPLREDVLIGFLLWGSGVFVTTELLSLFHAIGFWEVLIFWAAVLVLCLIIIFFHSSKGLRTVSAFDQWPFLERVFLNRIVFFSLSLGVVALVAPPNTYDAMTYHMSRVMHWIQDHGLTYYPTHIPRQLYYSNFPEYVILHFQLLSGDDHWANFVQWSAMGGSLVGVSLIAKELGAARMGQILSALIAVTLPMGVLQATSTQTDYVVTLWICIFIYFFLCWRKTLAWGHALLAGVSLGLAIESKGTSLIFAVPFLGWMLIEVVRRKDLGKYWMIGLVVFLACIFYAGSFYRNAVFFHGNAAKVLSADADSLINTRFCWEGLGANIIRNCGLHIITPSMSVNTAIDQDIYKLASFLHIDLNNRDWTYMGSPFSVIDFRGNENYLGNPLHFFLFGVVLVLFASRSQFRNRDAGFYLVACILGWLAFNVVLKWQPFHSRFHLPMFVMFSPIAGFVMERIKISWVVSGTMGALFLSAWVIVLVNVSKPIISTLSIFYPQNRDFLHFMMANSPQSTYLEYEGIAGVLKKMECRNIGLIMGPDENEYLLWTVLNPTADPAVRIESVLVNNASAALKYPLGDFIPDVIIAINDDRTVVNWENNNYQMVWHNQAEGKKVSILLKSP